MRSVGLYINESKMKYISINNEDIIICIFCGKVFEKVDDFVYFGFWIRDLMYDFCVRKVMVWSVCNMMKKI